MKTSNSYCSLLAIGFVSLFLMACPNNKGNNNNIPELGSYGDRSQITFAGTNTAQPFIEIINMPYAVGELRYSYNNQLKMNLYFFESDLASGQNPCLNLYSINNQNFQRSFTIQNLDYATRQPQILAGNYGLGNTLPYYNVPTVYFQVTDRARNVSMVESAYTGSITVLESSFDGALVRFDQVIANVNCYRTPENKNLACGSRISGQIRVAFCR